jgi:myo-inositol 2-dehydrogenase / D-chiro-inositol 1-dehydrogenase
MTTEPTRRNFIKTATATAAGVAAASQIARTAHAQGSDEIRFVLVGCGGRGTGAAEQIMDAKGKTRLVAVADAFERNAKGCLGQLSRKHKDKVDVSQEKTFTGLDAYKRAIDIDCDLVVIATPPGYKPQQFDYAISKGKHVFMEKPVASDAAGVRRVLKAVEESKKKNLMVGIGLQRRHEPNYIETIKRIHDGEIGDVICTRVYWNGGGIWHRPRQEVQTEMAYQTNNWYHFNWLSGDQICEQHIHNLDVGCWLKGSYPVECNGMGGGEQRMGGDRRLSQIFDHTFCEYTFADGTKMYSQGRHLEGGWGNVSEFAHGTKGTANPAGEIFGANAWKFSGQGVNGHAQEQLDLVAALQAGEIYNEGEYGAHSTLCAILGREACYSGKVVKWDELLANGKDLCPGIDNYTMDSTPPTVPDENGYYPVPVPGKYNPFA